MSNPKWGRWDGKTEIPQKELKHVKRVLRRYGLDATDSLVDKFLRGALKRLKDLPGSRVESDKLWGAYSHCKRGFITDFLRHKRSKKEKRKQTVNRIRDKKRRMGQMAYCPNPFSEELYNDLTHSDIRLFTGEIARIKPSAHGIVEANEKDCPIREFEPWNKRERSILLRMLKRTNVVSIVANTLQRSEASVIDKVNKLYSHQPVNFKS